MIDHKLKRQIEKHDRNVRINNAMEVSVIQLRHDEFPRYETTGYPYYVNVFVLMAASFFFVTHFAFSDFSKVKGVRA
mgnify:CR=1 FL=1